jgi:hypothetical protein
MAACRRYEPLRPGGKRIPIVIGALEDWCDALSDGARCVYLNVVKCVKGYNIKVMGGLLVSKTATD